MGMDIGFDIYPTISAEEQDRWQLFLAAVKGRYFDDPNVTIADHKIEFNVGEYPRIETHSAFFVRFSSKVSGDRTRLAEPYIRDVFRLARYYFPNKVHFWSELEIEFDKPIHTWTFVNDMNEQWQQWLKEKK